MRSIFVLIFSLVLGACASSSVIPISQDMVRITSEGELDCGITSLQKMAFRQASVETIRRGYDRFIVIGAENNSGTVVAGNTPVAVNSLGSISGGTPFVFGSQTQGLVVKMFKEDDPAANNALVARNELGPKWAELVNQEAKTCLD